MKVPASRITLILATALIASNIQSQLSCTFDIHKIPEQFQNSMSTTDKGVKKARGLLRNKLYASLEDFYWSYNISCKNSQHQFMTGFACDSRNRQLEIIDPLNIIQKFDLADEFTGSMQSDYKGEYISFFHDIDRCSLYISKSD